MQMRDDSQQTCYKCGVMRDGSYQVVRLPSFAVLAITEFIVHPHLTGAALELIKLVKIRNLTVVFIFWLVIG